MIRVLALLVGLCIGDAAIAAEPLTVEIIGHRGASWDAPENTVSAMNLAWEQQSDGVEFDIYLTRDGQIVACHDKDTKRTAGVSKLIAESTLAELRLLDVGTWKNVKFAGERIPTLEELLSTVPTGKKVYIEVKCGPEIVPALSQILMTAKLPPAQTPVICFNAAVIASLKELRPDLPAYYLYSLKADTTAEFLIAKAQEIHADGLDLSANQFLTKELASQVRSAGLRLDVWTVNDATIARNLVGFGVQGITTDRPGWLRDQLSP